MLAHIGGEDGLAAGESVELFQHVLGAQAPLLGVAQRILLAPSLALLDPVGGVELVDEGQQLLDHGAGVAAHEEIGLEDLAVFSGVDVDVDLHRFGTEFRKFTHDAIIPACPDGDDQIAVHHRLVGVGGAMHSEHSEMQRVVFRDGSLAEQGIDHRSVQLFGKQGDGLAGIRDHGAVAHVEHGLLGARKQLRQKLQVFRLRVLGQMIAGQVHFTGVLGLAGRRSHVLGQIDQHRARPACGGDVEGLAHHPRHVVGALHQIAVLHHLVGDAGDVGFLEGVFAEHG